MTRHVLIECVTPSVDGGRYPAKRAVGEGCRVEADVFRDGHDVVRALLKWRRRRDARFTEVAMEPLDNDRFGASFPTDEAGTYVYTLEAWSDGYATWLADLRKRVAVKQASVRSEVLEGIDRLDAIATRAKGEAHARLVALRDALAAASGEGEAALDIAASAELLDLVARHQERSDLVVHEPELELRVDPRRALFSAWYELFVRSQSPDPQRSGTFADAERRLPDLQAMGFDVVYLAPIHPIGTSNRKGRNNSLTAEPGDPGSPWAIGSEAGGHDAIEPALGTLDDFDRFVAAARALDIDVALDFAIQASPDHPWVKRHPQWFFHRPDGTIKYAENPPKKYQDVYPLNFDSSDWQALWEEMRRVVLFWVEHGVRIFRVDNPHTKPFAFWEWLIAEVQRRHPEVIFLSEAFTRPKVMKALAKAGFTQSYTYFTWRTAKAELSEYLEEVSRGEAADYFRPNFFANTPDILHEYLQTGGPPAFKVRLVLAATGSPAYGIYSGYELHESVPVKPGSEEYLDSEKYQVKWRDWDAPGSLREYIARINRIRRENPALQELRNLTLLPSDVDEILFFARTTADHDNVILVAVNLDCTRWREGTVTVPAEVIGREPGERFTVSDLITGATWEWGEHNYVKLDPQVEPAHVLRVERKVAP